MLNKEMNNFDFKVEDEWYINKLIYFNSNKTITVWLSGWRRILGPYSTQHVLGSIPDTGESHNGGQGEAEISLRVFLTLGMVDYRDKTTSWSPCNEKNSNIMIGLER